MHRTFDRVLMPFPRTAEHYLDLALAACRPGGWLHFYDFQAADAFSESVEKVVRACGRRELTDTHIEVCGHCSPRIFRICVDVRLG